MDIEYAVREALSDLADDTRPVDGLATIALRRARRRQYAARTALAGTAAAVAIPVGVAVLHDPGADSPIDPVISSPAAEPPAARRDILSAPSARELSTDELAAAFETCQGGVDDEGDVGDGWEPAFGITVEAVVDNGVPTTWVVAHRDGDYRADCALDSSANVVSDGLDGEYGLKNTPDLLYALVDGQEGSSVGRYVDPVTTVTVQYEDELEQQAVLRGGFWFLPMDETRQAADDIAEGASLADRERAVLGDWDLIGVPPGFTFRGYDSGGRLVYDSTTDGPRVDDCYADPTGTEIVGNGAGHSDPSTCVPTHQWHLLP